MHDLRVRFGFILAMALLPLLVFSIWHSVEDYNNQEIVDRTALLKSSRAVVSEVIDRVDIAKGLLRTVGSRSTKRNCEQDLRKVVDEFARYEQLSMFSATGDYMCSAYPRLDRNFGRDISLFSLDEPFIIYSRQMQRNGQDKKVLFVIAYADYNDGELKNIYTLASDSISLSSLKDENLIKEGVFTAVINRRGENLIDKSAIADFVDEDWLLEASEQDEVVEKRVALKSGTMRNFLILPTKEPEIFIAVTTPAETIFSGFLANSLISLIVPLLAWSFAFFAIWLATNKLLISHLRPMRDVALGFATGNYGQRIGNLHDAPAQIQELADTFDIMAETISVRDTVLREALEDKEILLREIHHRVKNNLQIIISLLNMQKRQLKDPVYSEALTETRNRINAIALVHKALYESDDITNVPMRPFLTQLIKQVSRAYLLDRKKIKVNMEIDSRPRDADRATTIAMFIVEAMTNSVKHGIPRGGNISVTVKDVEDETYVEVSDDGRPASDEVEGTGTGKRLMNGFARQLSGRYQSKKTDNGYVSTLVFPKTL